MTITLPITLQIIPGKACSLNQLVAHLQQNEFAVGLSGDIADHIYEWLSNEEGFDLEGLGVHIGDPTSIEE